jgi:hypothetical protein
MSNNLNFNPKHPFFMAWVIMAALVVSQAVYIGLCHGLGAEIRHVINPEQRVLVRSILYGVTIMLFPLTTLTRHILCRLNQTMPGDKPAPQRYLSTVMVSLAIMEIVGVFGLVMFVLGDDFNTLYIFSGLACLGFFLQRPKDEEYQAIVAALNHRH